MATVRAQGPAGEPTTLTVVARGDRVLVDRRTATLIPGRSSMRIHTLRRPVGPRKAGGNSCVGPNVGRSCAVRTHFETVRHVLAF